MYLSIVKPSTAPGRRRYQRGSRCHRRRGSHAVACGRSRSSGGGSLGGCRATGARYPDRADARIAACSTWNAASAASARSRRFSISATSRTATRCSTEDQLGRARAGLPAAPRVLPRLHDEPDRLHRPQGEDVLRLPVRVGDDEVAARALPATAPRSLVEPPGRSAPAISSSTSAPTTAPGCRRSRTSGSTASASSRPRTSPSRPSATASPTLNTFFDATPPTPILAEHGDARGW